MQTGQAQGSTWSHACMLTAKRQGRGVQGAMTTRANHATAAASPASLHESSPLAQAACCRCPWPPLKQPAAYPNCRMHPQLACTHPRLARTHPAVHTRTGTKLTQLQDSSSGSTRAVCSPGARHCYAAHTLTFGAVTLHALVRLPPPGLQSGRPPPTERLPHSVHLRSHHRPGRHRLTGWLPQQLYTQQSAVTGLNTLTLR